MLVVVNRPEWQVWQWYFVVDLADAFVFGIVGYVLLSRVSHPVAGLVVGLRAGGGVGGLRRPVDRAHLPAPVGADAAVRAVDAELGVDPRARWR